MFEPFAILLALLPLIGYLVVFSLIRLSGNVLVTTGGRDIAALAFGISGAIVVGPIELFFPRTAATVIGATVWIVLAIFYVLCVTLIALTSRPKLVIYGRTPAETFQPLLTAVKAIDADAIGDEEKLQISLPSAGIRLRIAGQQLIDHAEVLAFEPHVLPSFWGKLLSELRGEIGQSKTTRASRGLAMLMAACLLTGILLWQSFGNQELVVQGFREWLWR